MIEEVVGGVFKILGRFLGQIFLEIVFEFLIKGPGYLISKSLSKSNPDPDGLAVVIFGILFWLVIGVAVYIVYTSIVC